MKINLLTAKKWAMEALVALVAGGAIYFLS